MTPSEEFLRLKALLLVQAADVSSLLATIRAVGAAVRKDHPDLVDVDASFLSLRKQYLHGLLEDYEDTDPAFAARLQQVIDESSKNFPFDYE